MWFPVIYVYISRLRARGDRVPAQVPPGVHRGPVRSDAVHRGRDQTDLPGLQGGVSGRHHPRGNVQIYLRPVLPPGW